MNKTNQCNQTNGFNIIASTPVKYAKSKIEEIAPNNIVLTIHIHNEMKIKIKDYTFYKHFDNKNAAERYQKAIDEMIQKAMEL